MFYVQIFFKVNIYIKVFQLGIYFKVQNIIIMEKRNYVLLFENVILFFFFLCYNILDLFVFFKISYGKQDIVGLLMIVLVQC